MAQENLTVILGRPFRKALSANSNDSSFASRVPTVVEPTSDGVVNLAWPHGGTVPQSLLVLPYGLGSDNDAFDLRVIGWRHIGAVGQGPALAALWVPTILVEVTCTISAAVGVAGSPVLNTERFADTITVKSAGFEPTYTADTTRAGSVRIFSPTNDLVGWFVLALDGLEKIEFTFDQTTNTPTMNALIALL
jgi:hypothetical protein